MGEEKSFAELQKELLLKHFDYKGLAKDELELVLKPKLRELAAKTDGKIDDVAVELIIGVLDKVVADL